LYGLVELRSGRLTIG